MWDMRELEHAMARTVPELASAPEVAPAGEGTDQWLLRAYDEYR